ncbi:hypothetical protein Thiowin_05061 [Thiorhodovibrio winogradskyi]|uniref:Uncharacterized protein n=1 Tax=Thiorhodovibrio winogradskyi TaxID=77007 RepID=A0ABZ0SGW6_9GAMM
MRERCLAAFAKTFFSAGPSALATCGGEWLCVRADTGVTRGKRLVVLIAQPKALGMAVRQTGGQRLTRLR